MAEREYSRYQQSVIKRYYENREGIDEQRLSELVTRLYLATDKQKPKLWKTAEDLLERLEVVPSRIEHAMQSQDVTVLAKIVEDMQKGVLKRQPRKKKPGK